MPGEAEYRIKVTTYAVVGHYTGTAISPSCEDTTLMSYPRVLCFLLALPTPQTRLDTDFCPGSLWVADKRYAWFDLTANLTFYGPGPGGRGQVGHTLAC